MKSTLKPMKYITNRRGQKIGVVLDIRVYRNMIADIEELESIRAYGTAKISGDQRISFKEAYEKSNAHASELLSRKFFAAHFRA